MSLSRLQGGTVVRDSQESGKDDGRLQKSRVADELGKGGEGFGKACVSRRNRGC